MNGEINFLHESKNENLLQIHTMTLIGMIKHAKSSQNSMFAMSLQYLKKDVRDEVDFLHTDRVSCKLVSILWASKVPTRWYYHYWWTWSSILKVLKVTSLQYLHNISEKELGMEFIFLHAGKHQSFYKLALSFLMEVARHVQST